MKNPISDENPYKAPLAAVSNGRSSGSPRRRFWLSCAGWLLPIPTLAMLVVYLMPNWLPAVLVGVTVLWLVNVRWVIEAHQHTGFVYKAAIAIGLSISLAVSFTLGSALLLIPMVGRPVVVTLPQRAS